MAEKKAKKAVSAKTASPEAVEAQKDDLHDEAGLPEHGVTVEGVSHEDAAVVEMAAKEHAGAVQDAKTASEAKELAEKGADHREQWTKVQLENVKADAAEAYDPTAGPISEAEALAKQNKEVADRLAAAEKKADKEAKVEDKS